MNTKNRILAGLLIGQFVLAAFLLWPRGEAAGPVAGPLLTGVAADQIQEMTIRDGAGKSLTMARGSDGLWILPAQEGYPAARAKVDSFLQKLLGLSRERLVTRTVSSHKRLKVAADEHERLVELKTGPETSVSLYLGTSPSYKTIHMRLAGDDAVFLGRDLHTWEAGLEPEAWWETAYLKLAADEITGLMVENAQGRLELTRPEGQGWQLLQAGEAKPAKAEAVEELVRAASGITMTKSLGRTEKPEYGLVKPTLSVSLSGKERQVGYRIGAKQETSYPVKSTDSPFVVQVAEFSLQGLLAAKAEDLLAPPPPSPEPLPEPPAAEALPVLPEGAEAPAPEALPAEGLSLPPAAESPPAPGP
ncbi:MAG: DUF4340 domain-containing protein [Thermodesulfobacteriota bacterium]